MDLEKIGKISYQFVLTVIEWGFKICALVAGMSALAAKGSFGSKVAAGFGSLTEGLRQLVAFPATFKEMSWAAREYHQLGAAEFRETYGMAPVEQLMSSLNGYFTFFHEISLSLSQTPFISIIAALLVFGLFYVLGWIIRFARQRGQASYLSRMEQQLGDRVFNRRERLKEKVREFANRQATEKRIGQSSPKLT